MNIDFDIFGLKNPYTRFDKSLLIKNYKHISNKEYWFYKNSIPLFERLIKDIKPKTIIEVGSFLGYSAVNMGKICKENDLNTKILCIDTWLGSHEHWTIDNHKYLENYDYFENGISSMYDRFIQIVLSHNLENNIIPLPNTSYNMYHILKNLNITGDLIFVDGEHSAKGVYEDLINYWQLLNPGGVLFGDDFTWSSVKEGCKKFSNETGVKIEDLRTLSNEKEFLEDLGTHYIIKK